jgi:NAD(P)-dependent dehydrogenase (short-subunit alcohol dehydrogenase family)
MLPSSTHQVGTVNISELHFLLSHPTLMKRSGRLLRKVLSSDLLTVSKGGFLFAQQAIPLLIETAKTNPTHPPTLLFTGATASIKASIGFSAFASAKWALRALSQSLAKEFGPQGVHVGHIIADGGFDTPLRKSIDPNGDEETWMSTEGMAQSYWALHTQPKRAWSWEIDLRPYLVRYLLNQAHTRKNGDQYTYAGDEIRRNNRWNN